MRSTLVRVAVVVVVVLAGCTAPGVTVDSQATVGGHSPAPTTAVTPAENGTANATGNMTMQSVYGIDANRTIERVSTMLGVEYERPSIVLSINRTRRLGSNYRESLTDDPFLKTFGLADSAARGENGSFRIAGYVDGPHSVVMNPNLTIVQAETTLAHELVHVVQWQKGWLPELNGRPITAYRASSGRDVRTVATAIQEGTAEYAQSAYYERYVGDLSVRQRLASVGSYYRNLSGSTQLAWAPYYYGHRYVAQRVTTASEIGAVFASAPVTTEQLVHNLSQAEEPPVPMAVETDFGTVDRQGSQGELFIRIALSQALNRSRAARAAAGWGNDTLLSVETDATEGYVWVTRWDTETDAAEFESAIADFEADQFVSGVTGINTVRPAPRTVAVVVGPREFRQASAITAANGTVTVSRATS